MSEKDLAVKGRAGFVALPPRDWVVAVKSGVDVGVWIIHSGLTEEEAKILQKKYGRHTVAFRVGGKV